MDDFSARPRHADVPAAGPVYRPPTVTYLGDVAELTRQKTVGAADGATFAGLDIGTI